MAGLGLQLTTALLGDFDVEVAKGRARVERSLIGAVFQYVDEIEALWEADIARSGMRSAARLSKTIQTARYPNEGLDAAGRVFSKFPVIQQAFEAETVVRSSVGSFLLVPNPKAWPDGRVRMPTRGRGRKNTLAIAERTFGRLRLVYRKDGPSWLIADSKEAAARGGTPDKPLIVFYLLPQVRLPRLLRGKDIRARARREAPVRLQQLFVEKFEADGSDA